MGVAIARLPRKEWAGFAGIVVAVLILTLSPKHLYQNVSAIDASVSMIRVLYWGIPAALIVYGALTMERHFTEWSRPLAMLGDASYSIYLFHLFPILLIPGPWPLRFAAAVASGVIVWWLVERPLTRLLHPSQLRCAITVTNYELR